MNLQNAYKVNILGLKQGKHEFEYHIGDAFFALFEHSLIEKGDLKVVVVLDKTDRLIDAHFSIKGTIELICDRTLRPFNQDINISEQIIFQYADKYEEMNESLVHIPHGEHQLDLSSFLYELICVEVPMRKLHPDLETDEDSDEDLLIYTSAEDLDEEEDSDDGDEDEFIDPRWQALKRLKGDDDINNQK